jgi:flagellar protein FliO/FliZ
MTGQEPGSRFPSVMRTRHALSAAVLGPLVVAPAAPAQDGERTPLRLDEPQAAGSAGGGLVRTIVGLAVVIGVIYGLHWVLKQVKSAREGSASGSGLKPIASLPLGGNRTLHLVRAGQEVVLVGSGEGGVTPIRTYTEAEARALGLIGDDDDAGDPPDRVEAQLALTGKRSVLDRLRDRTVIR